MIKHFLSVLMLLGIWSVAYAQTPDSVREGPNNTRVAVSSHEGARNFQAHWGYSPAVRSGDYIHMSGVIAGPTGNEPIDGEAFKDSLRGSFSALNAVLKSLDASLADVVKIHTYHVFKSAYFSGDKLAHMEAVRTVKNEFMGDATPAWTAIGVSELFTDSGLVEIELTVYAPLKKKSP